MNSWTILSCISHGLKYCSEGISVSVDPFAEFKTKRWYSQHKIKNGCTPLQLREKETGVFLQTD